MPSYKRQIADCPILSCKNICVKLSDVRGRFKVPSPYQNGFRYCRRCEVYLKCENSHCPCCGLHLRFTPVSPVAKEKLRLVQR